MWGSFSHRLRRLVRSEVRSCLRSFWAEPSRSGLRSLEQLEADMGLLADLASLSTRQGPLVLRGPGRARLEAVTPVFDQVSRESGANPRGPIPATFMMSIAWTESAFRPTAVGPAIAGTSARA